jgi:hypothetical protein
MKENDELEYNSRNMLCCFDDSSHFQRTDLTKRDDELDTILHMPYGSRHRIRRQTSSGPCHWYWRLLVCYLFGCYGFVLEGAAATTIPSTATANTENLEDIIVVDKPLVTSITNKIESKKNEDGMASTTNTPPNVGDNPKITSPKQENKDQILNTSISPSRPMTMNHILLKAGKRGLGGGLPGAVAGVIQVLSLMWVR